MTEKLKTLKRAAKNIFAELHKIHDLAVEEKRDLTPTEQVRWDDLMEMVEDRQYSIEIERDRLDNDLLQGGSSRVSHMTDGTYNSDGSFTPDKIETRNQKGLIDMEKNKKVDEKELRAFGEFCLNGESRTLQKDLDASGGFAVLPATL